jgi:hypothetical protein
VIVVAIVGLVALSGCGTGSDRADVRDVTGRFFSALDSRNGVAACGQLSRTLRQTIVQDKSAQRCGDAVVKLKTRGSAVRALHVYATSARVDLARGESVFLSATRAGWRIEALGCRPRASGPYECEEQG